MPMPLEEGESQSGSNDGNREAQANRCTAPVSKAAFHHNLPSVPDSTYITSRVTGDVKS
jgi:hypothetical protein